jgi:hypothetical protein
MTDRDVQREIEANEQRDRVRDDDATDDGPVIDTAERVVNPIVNAIGMSEEPDRDDLEERRFENDEEQRGGI